MQDIVSLFKKMGVNLESKDNEVMNTGNTGYGAEFIPSQIMATQLMDLTPQFSKLLPLLPSNHGNNLPKTYTQPVRGMSVGDTLFQGKGQWTTGYPYQTQDDHGISRVPTQNVTLSQVPFICEVQISDDQLRYNAVNTEEYVKQEIAKGMAWTVDSVIINGDSETGSTGNVNSDDQAPATTFAATGGAKDHRLMIDGGIRERAINGSYTKDFGTLADTDYSDLMTVLGRYATNVEDLLFVQSIHVTNKMKALDAFKLWTNSGDKAGIQKGITPTPFGVDVLTHQYVPRTEADGKMSGATLANNVKGQTLLIYKPAIQYGFGKEMTFEVSRVPGYGWRIICTFDFAFTIVDSANSLSEPTVAAGINITVT